MAKEISPAAAPAAVPETSKESMSLQKILMIGIPIVLVQIVLMYFIFVKFIAPSMSPAQNAAAEQGPAGNTAEEASQVLVIKDLIINPAGTNGTRFLLTTVGLEVPSAEIKAELEQKEIQTRDILNTVLTSKGLDELTIPQFKETLRKEIQEKLNANLRSGKISNVYFSKFIIQ